MLNKLTLTGGRKKITLTCHQLEYLEVSKGNQQVKLTFLQPKHKIYYNKINGWSTLMSFNQTIL